MKSKFNITIKRIILILCFTSLNLVFANTSNTRGDSSSIHIPTTDMINLDKLYTAINNKKWNQAEEIIVNLNLKYPDTQLLKNLLAVVYFNQGKVIIAQDLLIEVIEDSNSSKIAYHNLKKIFSYAAAKTYSEGLQLLSPIKQPRLTVDTKTSLVSPEKIAALKIQKDILIKNKTELEAKNQLKKNENKQFQLIKNRINAWKESWEKGQASKYIEIYSSNYQGLFKNRKKWIKNRFVKVNRLKAINLDLTEFSFKISSNQVISVFKQKYQSNTYMDKVLKEIIWQIENGKWVIIKETTIKTL